MKTNWLILSCSVILLMLCLLPAAAQPSPPPAELLTVAILKKASPSFKRDTALVIAYNILAQKDMASNLSRAKSYADSALTITERIKWQKGIASTYMSLSAYYGTTGYWDKANTLIQQSIQISKQLGDKQGELAGLFARGILYWDVAGNYEKSLSVFNTCLHMAADQKDSYTMLEILRNLQQSAPINFSLVAVNLDQKQPGFPEHVLPEYLEKLGVEYKIVEENTYGIVKEKIPEGKTTCSLCSRLRRGILYRTATELGATKIALGHHRDDILQTLFLNMFYGGKMKGMPPKLMSDDGKHIVIRPLAYCREKDIQRFADAKAFPIIPCNLCGSQPNLQRQVIADMLRDWDKRYPGRIETMFSAMQNVVPSHLCDTNLFDFKGITHGSEVVNGGDLAFDREEIPLQPAGWQPEEDENQLDELRLNVVEVK